jgi:hypothetical protein
MKNANDYFPWVNANLVNPLPSNLPTEIPDSSNYKFSDITALVNF